MKLFSRAKAASLCIRVAACALSFCLGAYCNKADAAVVESDSLSVDSISPLQPTGGRVVFATSAYIVGGASVTLHGGSGFIFSESSVTASSFWGHGGGLTGIVNNVVLSATQSFSAAQSFESSFTVTTGGREISLSTSASSHVILISTSGILTFDPSLHNSSSTTFPFYQTTRMILGPCIDGSTLTIHTTGGRVELNFSATYVVETSTPIGPILSFLQDGQYVDGMSATVGLGVARTDCAADVCPISFGYLIGGVALGTHSYCLTVAALPAGINPVITIDSSNNGAGSGRNLFFVKEIK